MSARDIEGLVARLCGGKCPACNGWGEVAYCGELVDCGCGKYETPISMESRREAAEALLALKAENDGLQNRIKTLEKAAENAMKKAG